MADSLFDASKMPFDADPAAVLPRTTAPPIATLNWSEIHLRKHQQANPLEGRWSTERATEIDKTVCYLGAA